MDVEHADPALADLEFEPGATARLPEAVVKAYRKRMQAIRAVADERDFYAMKSWHFEKLKGDRRGQYSMRLNDQFRLILELTAVGARKRVVIVSIEDYH